MGAAGARRGPPARALRRRRADRRRTSRCRPTRMPRCSPWAGTTRRPPTATTTCGSGPTTCRRARSSRATRPSGPPRWSPRRSARCWPSAGDCRPALPDDRAGRLTRAAPGARAERTRRAGAASGVWRRSHCRRSAPSPRLGGMAQTPPAQRRADRRPRPSRPPVAATRPRRRRSPRDHPGRRPTSPGSGTAPRLDKVVVKGAEQRRGRLPRRPHDHGHGARAATPTGPTGTACTPPGTVDAERGARHPGRRVLPGHLDVEHQPRLEPRQPVRHPHPGRVERQGRHHRGAGGARAVRERPRHRRLGARAGLRLRVAPTRATWGRASGTTARRPAGRSASGTSGSPSSPSPPATP